MPKVQEVKKARNDYPDQGIKKGEPYFWWKFNFSKTINRSKKYPSRSQLTKSSFLSGLYDLQDDWTWEENDELDSQRDDLVSQIEELKSQCEDSLSNMPEHLQESSDSGMTLQERIEALDEWIDNLNSVDCDIETHLPDGYNEMSEEDQEYAKEEAIQQIIDELSSCECNL
jgi:seryl-tRNA synthetase